tara:strand:- start:6749 stop:9880 length:3132 start_codon:yes stop_codon:yes gene_type:complete
MLSSLSASPLKLESSLFQTQITGTVKSSADQLPMPGVSVVEKGTSNGAVTDFDGNFKLNVSSNDAVLVFSFIGFKTMERRLEGKTFIEIFMEEDQAQLDEVVLVGYSEQRREVITGAVATVSSEELAKSPTLNVSNALTGRMPGVVATQNSGEPGYDGSTISIRGSNSFGDNSPLVVIDGIPDRQGGFSRLNPADIKDISVLKDASAAIYGARAANGVILVTTKRGKVGKTSLSYDYNLGFSKPTVIPDLANASQYAMMRNELEIYKLPVSEWSHANAGFMSDGVYTRPSGGEVTAPFSPEDIRQFQDGSDPWFHPDTDWFSETLKDWSTQSRHTLQITGGTEDLKILSTIGYQNQDAYYKKSATNYKQYDIRLNMDAKINDYITAKIGVLGRQEDRNYPTKPASSIFRMLMRSSPTQPAYWPNGMPGPDIEYGENPVVITTDQTGYDRDRRYYFQSNGQLDIEIPWVKGLKFTGTAAVDKYIQQTKRWEIPWYLYTWQGGYTDDGTPELVRGKRGPAEPNLNQGNQDQLNILLGGVLNFERKFGFHQINVLAGVNRETIRNDSFSAYRRYFISTVIDQLFAGGDAEKDNDGRAWERARLNYFGRVGYNYKEKYLAEFLWRYDGSYMFPEDSRYGFFPGVMIGWRVSEENFWKENLKLINFFKIRASYGQMGNDNIYYDDELQEYQYFATYGFSNYVTGSALSQTLFETRVPNTAVTWEVANNYNLGFDGRMWEGKVNFTLDLFLNKRSSILWRRNASVPQTTGMSLPAENIGEVENRGWDFQLGYNNQFGDLMFSASINGGYAKNKIVFWDEAPGAPQWQRSTGRMINAGLYYEYDGVFATQEEIDNNTIDYSAITNNLRPGDMKYRDYDGDGAITPDDQVRRDKTTQPTFQGGVNFNFQYKDFDLSVLFQGAAGGELRVGADESGSIGNYLKEVYDNRWTIDNPSSTHPRIADRGNQYYSFGNTYWLQSTDYLRLKNIELGYNLPQQLADKVGINNFRLYVSAYNLVTWTGMESFDPEAVNSIGQYYPQSKIINLGARINF